MPSKNTKQAPTPARNLGPMESAFVGAMDDLISEIENEVDIIVFAEDPEYLDMKLHPVQKLILKSYYGLKLDDTEKAIQVRHFPSDAEGDWMTELGYIKFLMQQNRCNVSEEWLENPWRLQELILACGRRGGKSVLSAIISCYEAYRLIAKGNPQKHYQLTRRQRIKIVNLAPTKEQASELLESIQNMIFDSPWFAPYIDSYTQYEIRLKTRSDIKAEQQAEQRGVPVRANRSIRIESLPCSASGSRGGTTIVIILDEFAHFIDGDGNRSGGTILAALSPSTATFGMDARIMLLSSPYQKGGEFYSRFKKGMGDREKGVAAFERPTGVSEGGHRCFRIPTWEMNPKISFDFLKTRAESTQGDDFEWEFGAEFSTTVTGFFKYPEKLDACIEMSKEMGYFVFPMRQRVNAPHYIAVDPSTVGHGYALCMAHVEALPRKRIIMVNGEEKETIMPESFVVVDRWRRWMSADPEFEDCAETDKGIKIIDPKVIEEYILKELLPAFRVTKIFYDQFESAGSVNSFHKKGINCIRKAFSTRFNMQIYRALETLVYDGRLLFPDDSHGGGTELGMEELRYLQKIKHGAKKNFKVEAQPDGDVTTDDLADVLASVCFHLVTDKAFAGSAKVVGTGPTAIEGAKRVIQPKTHRGMSNLSKAANMDPHRRYRQAGWRQ